MINYRDIVDQIVTYFILLISDYIYKQLYVGHVIDHLLFKKTSTTAKNIIYQTMFIQRNKLPRTGWINKINH